MLPTPEVNMPTENELKFVLSKDLAPRINEFLTNPESGLRDRIQGVPIQILQGYLYNADGVSARVRHSSSHKGPDHTTLTFKQDVPETSDRAARVVEIETTIDENDWLDLFRIAKETLIKTRYHLWFRRPERQVAIFSGFPKATTTLPHFWEIDLFWEKFHEDGEPYFILAEHEMPEGQAYPHFIPDLIQQFLIYAVPREETQVYSSRRLSDIEYARQKYRELTAQKEVTSVSPEPQEK